MFTKKSAIGTLLSIEMLLLSLCACSSASGSQSQIAERQAEPTPDTNSSDIAVCTAASENGFYRSDIYFTGGANISYIDFSSKKEFFLCGSPNCTHDNEGCPSFYPFSGKTQLSGVLVAGDHLLAFQEVASETESPHIDLLSLNGNFEKRLIEFGANQKLPPTAMDGSYCFDGENLYFVLTDIEQATTSDSYSIVALSLETGNLNTVYQFPSNDTYLSIYSAFGRNLVIAESDSNFNSTISFLNVDSCEKTPSDFSFDNGKGADFSGCYGYDISFSKNCGTLINLTDNLEKSFDFSSLTNQVSAEYGSDFNSYVMPLSFTKDYCIIEYSLRNAAPDSSNRLDYVLNLNTGEFLPFGLYKPFNQDIMQVEAEYDGKLLIQTDWKTQTTTSQELYIPSWLLITPEDYLASRLQGEEIALLSLGNH